MTETVRAARNISFVRAFLLILPKTEKPVSGFPALQRLP